MAGSQHYTYRAVKLLRQHSGAQMFMLRWALKPKVKYCFWMQQPHVWAMESHLQRQNDQCFAKEQSWAGGGPGTLGRPEHSRSVCLKEQHTEAFTLGKFWSSKEERGPDVKTLICETVSGLFPSVLGKNNLPTKKDWVLSQYDVLYLLFVRTRSDQMVSSREGSWESLI